MTRGNLSQRLWLGLAVLLFLGLVLAGFMAPETLPRPDFGNIYAGPLSAPPLGADDRGISLVPRVLQGAQIIIIPAMIAASFLMLLSTMAGLARSAGIAWFDVALTAFSELVGALPRLVVILIIAVAVPALPAAYDALFGTAEGAGVLGGLGSALQGILPRPSGRPSLLPIALTWAILAAPQAMDEAAVTAGRLGGARFVEALRAHGFSAPRIYLYHIVWLNLRSVVVRQGAEVITQIAFLEIALSYMTASQNLPALTHGDNIHSWASLLYDGYRWWITATPMPSELEQTNWVIRPILRFLPELSSPGGHILLVGLVVLALVALMAHGFRMAARGR